MKGKAGAALFCLAFALPFGGIGLFAAWMAGTMVYDGGRARDWVLVKADVVGDSSYRYTFNGSTYTSDRLGTLRVSATSDTDDFDQRVWGVLASAREERRPITVFVNPENPSEAMVDRAIRWTFLMFLTPFALAFGGVGIGATYALYRVLRQPAKTTSGKKRSAAGVGAAAADSVSGVGGLWFFAIIWNSIAFPIAALAVPQAIQTKEYLLLFVLLFPLIGVAVLWAAITATFSRLFRGRPRFELATKNPRIGAPIEGWFEFGRGVRAGDAFRVKLVCERTFSNGNETSITPHWSRTFQAKAIQAPTGARIPFRVEAQGNLPATDDDDEGKSLTHRWRIELEPASKGMAVPYKQEIVMAPASSDAPRAPVEPPASVHPSLEQVLGRINSAPLTQQQKAALAQLTPEQQARVAKVLRFAPSMKKIVIAIVCLVVAMEVVPFIFELVR